MGSPEISSMTATAGSLALAMEVGEIVEAQATMCDAAHNLHVDLEGGKKGVIPRNEAALGVKEGTTRDIAIISRVGKPVCFKVIGVEGDTYILSRRAAQREALDCLMSNLSPGKIIPARVTHLESFGAFVDVGCGNISFIGIENISVSRISHPQERFSPRQDIFAVVTSIDRPAERITLSHRELLGTWEENCVGLRAGSTISGVVRGIEPYGAFVEISPNLSGLAEIKGVLEIGTRVAVFIKSLIPEKMKIKLVIIDTLEGSGQKPICIEDYKMTSGCISRWTYSPDSCSAKKIETVFSQ
jgi:small subunit ribosomal protein S1